MKIAEPESIKAGEQELINSIMEQLNSEIIESIASGRLVVNNLEFRNGDMIIHENRIVYKMEFETSVAITVLFDREGNLIDENTEVVEGIEVAEASEDIDGFEGSEDEKDEFSGEAESLIAGATDVTESEEASDDTDNPMELVIKKTRDFWLEKSRDAMVEGEITDAETEDEQFLDVMKKNKEFWQEQVANNQVAD